MFYRIARTTCKDLEELKLGIILTIPSCAGSIRAAVSRGLLRSHSAQPRAGLLHDECVSSFNVHMQLREVVSCFL